MDGSCHTHLHSPGSVGTDVVSATFPGWINVVQLATGVDFGFYVNDGSSPARGSNFHTLLEEGNIIVTTIYKSYQGPVITHNGILHKSLHDTFPFFSQIYILNNLN